MEKLAHRIFILLAIYGILAYLLVAMASGGGLAVPGQYPGGAGGDPVEEGTFRSLKWL